MQYLGGKKRVAKQLCEFLNDQIKLNDFKSYFEPFVGSCAIIENINHLNRIGNDINKYLIAMYEALQTGWIPPKEVSEEEYKQIRENKDIAPWLTGFVGIGCSFSGKWFGGYARDKKVVRNYALNAHNTLLKQLPKIKDVLFISKDYLWYEPMNSLIYCDPPYANTTTYGIATKFDSVLFWDTMREWSKDNAVFISEYKAPDDFECVLEIETRTDMKNIEGKMIPRIERLWKWRG